MSDEIKQAVREEMEKAIEEYKSEVYVDYNDEFNQFWDMRDAAKEQLIGNASAEWVESLTPQALESVIDTAIAESILEGSDVFMGSFDNVLDEVEGSDELDRETIDAFTKEYDERLNAAFSEFTVDAKRSAESRLIAISVQADGGFNEGGSEIVLGKYCEPSTVQVEDPLFHLLGALKISPKDFYDYLIKKNPDDEVDGKEILTDPTMYPDFLKEVEFNLAPDEIQSRLENLYVALENGSDMMEPVVLIEVGLEDYLALDFDKPMTIENAYVGLINYINGSGYVFDDKFNIDLQEKELWHGTKAAVPDGEYGYAIDSIFGFGSGVFDKSTVVPGEVAVSSSQMSMNL